MTQEAFSSLNMQVRKAKAHLELSLTDDFKGSEKGSYRYVYSKRKTRVNNGPTDEWDGGPCDKERGKS